MKSLKIVMLLAACCHFNAAAQWVEASGEAKILNGNVTQAREAAIEQALSYVTLRSGGEFSSEQQIQNGQLIKNQFSMMNHSQVGQVELLNEQVKNQVITVNLRVDVLQNNQSQCSTDNLKAAVLVPQAQMRDRAQLRYGHLGNFPQALSQHLGDIMAKQSKASYPNLHADERLDIPNSLNDIRGYRLPSWLNEITDSQYILIPDIMDISTDPADSSLLGLWSDAPQRQFQLRLSLYHGISGERVWSKDYNSPAEWEFEKQETVAANSNRFWQSTYGLNIQSVLGQASIEIDKMLSCRPLLGQIISKQQDRVIINLGRNNGIQVGDEFQIVLQQNLPDRLNNMRAVAIKSRANIVIDQVTQETATAKLSGENAAINIQINDLAIKQ
ncbi:flagellar assembly protein FlgT [Shewanella sp. Isolate11]|uniref:flagellar assembly protein FlgT n=1 Tax=Shewanella sp. Isolate11 TaxID=2908530 RepID=UPI001EFEC3A2|nr:flagellar assembly protein FlgT [Shewanella sp. Isolate11]MCG9697182.1 flagellar assembly protein FlgT [Shewanella sp. Isolate11]